eukprot:3420675-Rhodomonas_salina.1
MPFRDSRETVLKTWPARSRADEQGQEPYEDKGAAVGSMLGSSIWSGKPAGRPSWVPVSMPMLKPAIGMGHRNCVAPARLGYARTGFGGGRTKPLGRAGSALAPVSELSDFAAAERSPSEACCCCHAR